ncbi:MAG: stage III sporulation protein AD [Clostridia bacterium]|nr:stage III sporulation protein AD [Clostridia bacterium]
MNILSVVCIGVAASLLVLVLKDRPETGVVIAIAAGVIIIGSSLGIISEIFDAVNSISELAGIEGGYIKTVLKASGIALAVTVCSAICRDAGQTAIARVVEIAGRAAIIGVALPVINALFSEIVRVIK